MCAEPNPTAPNPSDETAGAAPRGNHTGSGRLEPQPERYLGQLRRAFDAHYAEGSDVWTADVQMRAFPAAAAERTGLRPGARVLDVGCGAGLDAAWFAAQGARVVGLDLHGHRDWDTLSAADPHLRFVAADLLAWAGDGAPFDLVFDNGCFHHQHPEHVGPWLARVRGLLAPGGAFVLSTFKNPALPAHVDGHGRLHRYYTDAELHGVLAAAGLRVAWETEVWQPRRGEPYRLTGAEVGPGAG